MILFNFLSTRTEPCNNKLYHLIIKHVKSKMPFSLQADRMIELWVWVSVALHLRLSFLSGGRGEETEG